MIALLADMLCCWPRWVGNWRPENRRDEEEKWGAEKRLEFFSVCCGWAAGATETGNPASPFRSNQFPPHGHSVHVSFGPNSLLTGLGTHLHSVSPLCNKVCGCTSTRSKGLNDFPFWPLKPASYRFFVAEHPPILLTLFPPTIFHDVNNQTQETSEKRGEERTRNWTSCFNFWSIGTSFSMLTASSPSLHATDNPYLFALPLWICCIEGLDLVGTLFFVSSQSVLTFLRFLASLGPWSGHNPLLLLAIIFNFVANRAFLVLERHAGGLRIRFPPLKNNLAMTRSRLRTCFCTARRKRTALSEAHQF